MHRREQIDVMGSPMEVLLHKPGGDGPHPELAIHAVYDAFGPERMFWGTDLSLLPCSYREGITHFSEELPFLSAPDKQLIMGEAICRWLGWKPPAWADDKRIQKRSYLIAGCSEPQ
jgi:hypothetical protein